MRARGDRTPVLMLTARHAVADRVAGLDAGADDYLAKPFVVRRAAGPAARRRTTSPSHEPLLTGRTTCTIDRDRRTVTRAGRADRADRPGVRHPRTSSPPTGRAGRHPLQILDEVWDGETDLRSNVIDVHIANLRAKVDRPFGRSSIETLRGAGYRLAAAGSSPA